MDVASLLQSPVERRANRSAFARVGAAWPWALGVMGVAAGLRLEAGGFFSSGGGPGLIAGASAGVGMALVSGYVLPKRFPKLWLKRKKAAKGKATEKSARLARSRLRPRLAFHIGAAAIVCGLVGLHTQMRIPNNVAGATSLAFWLTSLLGLFGFFVYRRLPETLTRLERKGLLPEDFPAERQRLEERFAQLVGQLDPGIRNVAQPALASYVRSTGVSLAMIVGGSSLGDEETKLRRQVGARLPPAASGATADIDEAVRTAVELRALPARIWLTRLLRAWLPIHIVSTAVVLTLLALHILLALGLSWT
jgi:hypothetical protein